MKRSTVCAGIVTYNSRAYIERCLESVFRQQGPHVEAVVIDNASTDGTRDILARYEDRARILYNARNTGFAAAQNQAIALSGCDWFLALNPDVLLEPDFLARLIAAGRADRKVGAVCGKLLAIGPNFTPLREPTIDSAGLYFTPAMRHFDRGWHEPDDSRYDRAEYVFGASAAAALYRREMIADISLPDGFFDPDFFAYREDADVAWRAQLLGWRCLYTPEAVAWHVRRVGPDNRRSLPALVNMHSVKNRFLLRIKNATGGLYRRYWLPVTMRDLAVIGCCLVFEVGSLPAFWLLAKGFRRALEKRRLILSRRRVSDETLARWFRPEPVAEPVPRLVFR